MHLFLFVFAWSQRSAAPKSCLSNWVGPAGFSPTQRPCHSSFKLTEASSVPVCCSSVLRASPPWPGVCFCPQGNPADGACASVRRPLSSGPCVVWLCKHVCGLFGPLLICPRPAKGLPSDHGCLLYFCLHQLNSDRPLPPAGPNQASALALSSAWRGLNTRQDRTLGPAGLSHLYTHFCVISLLSFLTIAPDS